MIAEGARHSVVRYDTQADFIGDQHDRPGHLGERVEQPALSSVDLPTIMHEVAKPHRQAIDQQTDRGCALPSDGLREIEWRFYCAPASPALATVRLDSADHLGIDTLGGGNVDPLAMTAYQALSECALARARAAEYQGPARIRFDRAHGCVELSQGSCGLPQGTLSLVSECRFGITGYRIRDDGKRGVGYIVDMGQSVDRWDTTMRAPCRCQ